MPFLRSSLDRLKSNFSFCAKFGKQAFLSTKINNLLISSLLDRTLHRVVATRIIEVKSF